MWVVSKSMIKLNINITFNKTDRLYKYFYIIRPMKRAKHKYEI